MNTMTITASIDGKAEPVDIDINLDNLNFACKQALQPWVFVMTGAQFPVDTINEQCLRDAGLVEMDTPEGTQAYINPKMVLGFFTPQLGLYVFVFNGSTVVVKGTKDEIETKLRVHTTPVSNLLITDAR